MSTPIAWTPERVAALRRLRIDEALSAETIGFRLHISTRAVWNALSKHGIKRPVVVAAPEPDHFRGPLPAGHPLSWNLICAGLACLDGVGWPG